MPLPVYLLMMSARTTLSPAPITSPFAPAGASLPFSMTMGLSTTQPGCDVPSMVTGSLITGRLAVKICRTPAPGMLKVIVSWTPALALASRIA